MSYISVKWLCNDPLTTPSKNKNITPLETRSIASYMAKIVVVLGLDYQVDQKYAKIAADI